MNSAVGVHSSAQHTNVRDEPSMKDEQMTDAPPVQGLADASDLVSTNEQRYRHSKHADTDHF